MRMLFTKHGKQPARSSKRKACVPGPEVTVDTQTMISGNIYQTWLKDPSSLVSKRRRVSSVCQCVIARDYLFSKMSELMHFTYRIDGCLFTCLQKINFIQETKIGDRMNLPPVGLMSCSENSPGFYYPKQLMQLWKECTETKSSKPSSSGHSKT
jgi:cohesin complex subunit SCC1